MTAMIARTVMIEKKSKKIKNTQPGEDLTASISTIRVTKITVGNYL